MVANTIATGVNFELVDVIFQFSNTRKAYFMICQRGPGAFIDGTRQMIHDSLADGAGFQKLYCSASSHISERISVLTSLRYFLATFLAKVRYSDLSYMCWQYLLGTPVMFLKPSWYHKFRHLILFRDQSESIFQLQLIRLYHGQVSIDSVPFSLLNIHFPDNGVMDIGLYGGRQKWRESG